MHRLRRAVAATLLVTLPAVACTGDDDGPSATLDDPTTTTGGSTVQAEVEAEVEAAYLRSWEVYAHALRTLSTAGLEESFAGAALASTIAEVDRLRSAGTPVRMSVEHQIEIDQTSPTSATVVDRYRNHAVLLNGTTGEPIEDDPNNLLTFSYDFKKENSTWFVTFVTRL